VVYVESPENHVVGEDAKRQSMVDADRTVDFVKRVIGKHKVAKIIDGQEYSPEAISASILKFLAKEAADYTQKPVRKVVITCPAYFGQAEILATKIAAEAAGLEVMQIIPEPIAAALSYGVKPDENKTVLIYDLGGGTFDVTLIKFTKDEPPEVVTADGNDLLGGKDWDDRLVKYFVGKFKEQCPNVEKDIEDDANAMQELRIRAEELKKKLTNREKGDVYISFENNTYKGVSHGRNLMHSPQICWLSPRCPSTS
jgi:molecular chaperone DnaK (HSP70)